MFKTRNRAWERQPHLCGEACPLFLLLSFPCFLFPMFISRSCHLYSYISSSVAGGWLGLTFLVPVHTCVCVSVCLCMCQHSVYFQSILFKDQTRGWWLIFLSLTFFHLLGKRRREGEKKRRGPPSTQAQEVRPRPLHPTALRSCPPEV